jgi:hypothetical protein
MKTKRVYLPDTSGQQAEISSGGSLPVSRLVEHMIAVASHSLATEERRESKTLRYHFLRNHHFTLGFGLSNHKLTDL